MHSYKVNVFIYKLYSAMSKITTRRSPVKVAAVNKKILPEIEKIAFKTSANDP